MRISVEGIRGSGKTVLLKLLSELGYQIHPIEPGGENTWTNLYHAQPDRFALGYNLYMLLEQINQRHHPNEIHLFENSPYTLQNVWSQLLLEKKSLHKEEFKLQEEIMDKWSWTPDCIIYLDCAPEVCLERLEKSKENNPALQKMTLPDLDEMGELAQQYDWVLDYSNCNIPVYRVNANDNLVNVFYHVLQILFQIKRHNLGFNPNYKGKNKGMAPASSYKGHPSQLNNQLFSGINAKSPLYSLLIRKTELLQQILEGD